MINTKSECDCCQHLGLCKYESQHREFEEELAKLQEAFISEKADWLNTGSIKYFCKHFRVTNGLRDSHTSVLPTYYSPDCPYEKRWYNVCNKTSCLCTRCRRP